jgi:hypothetical protein
MSLLTNVKIADYINMFSTVEPMLIIKRKCGDASRRKPFGEVTSTVCRL